MEVSANQPVGTPTWVDLGIPDLARAREFYGAVLGWEFGEEGPPETGSYTMCTVRGKNVAALAQNPDPGASGFWWNLYFATDDVDGTAKRITDGGGAMPMAPMDIMEQGRMAIATDGQGAQFGLWQGRAHVGAELVNESGGMIWNELQTADTATAAAFYGAVFDRDVTAMDVPDFDYRTINVDGRPVAGIWGVPDATTPRWTTCFAVDDADAAAVTAAENGGTVVREPQDSPYGRIAVLQDPFGAEFSVMRPADEMPM